MKPIILIPPAAALVIAGSLLATQHHSISVLEGESAQLRKQIAAARADPASSEPKRGGRPAAEKAKERLDWKKIAAELLEMQNSGGMGDVRTMIHLQQRLQSMTKEEIVSALDEIAKLDLPTQSREMLEQMLIGPLIEKDPELALNSFSGKFRDRDGLTGQLATALGKWAEKDLGKATAWFDQQIAAGNFDSKALDGRNSTRTSFEIALIGVLVGSDMAAATARVVDLPEDQKIQVLRNLSSNSPSARKEENQKAVADLDRNQLPEKESNKQIAMIAINASALDYSKASACLDRIAATPGERAAAAAQVAMTRMQHDANQRAITREDIDTMREWVSAQSPGAVDATTGRALAAAVGAFSGKVTFQDAAAFALQYQASSGNDEVLASFLARPEAQDHKEEAIKLAEKISDETRREEVLSRLK